MFNRSRHPLLPRFVAAVTSGALVCGSVVPAFAADPAASAAPPKEKAPATAPAAPAEPKADAAKRAAPPEAAGSAAKAGPTLAQTSAPLVTVATKRGSKR